MVAVDQLLLAEVEELPCGEEVGAFHRARRGERPARPTRALNLDAGDGVLVALVEAGGQPCHLLLRGRRGGRRAVSVTADAAVEWERERCGSTA